MAKCKYAALPAPHGNVHVRAQDFDDSIYLVYTGAPDALLAAGAVEPHMVLGARTCGSGKDSFGNRYRRKLSGRRGRIEVARYVRSIQMLPQLPGYEDAWIPEPIRWLSANPDKLHISDAEDGEQQITGTKEALIAQGLVCAESFDFSGFLDIPSGFLDIPSAPGYTGSRLTNRCGGGYYRLIRVNQPPREFTPEQRVYSAQLSLEYVGGIARACCGPETQSRIGVHITAIMDEFHRALPPTPARSGHLRLVVDNARSSQRGADG